MEISEEKPAVNSISFHPETNKEGHRKHRIRNFFLPDGRKAHVAASPEEALRLKERLIQLHPDGNFELFVNGSNEHVRQNSQISASL